MDHKRCRIPEFEPKPCNPFTCETCDFFMNDSEVHKAEVGRSNSSGGLCLDGETTVNNFYTGRPGSETNYGRIIIEIDLPEAMIGKKLNYTITEAN